ncbi:hypothetical protein DNK01_04310 [Stutzerimonas kirkiae]|nr:hypothetical protein DNK01_04310 [Stutzerimonas kirkiae]
MTGTSILGMETRWRSNATMRAKGAFYSESLSRKAGRQGTAGRSHEIPRHGRRGWGWGWGWRLEAGGWRLEAGGQYAASLRADWQSGVRFIVGRWRCAGVRDVAGLAGFTANNGKSLSARCLNHFQGRLFPSGSADSGCADAWQWLAELFAARDGGEELQGCIHACPIPPPGIRTGTMTPRSHCTLLKPDTLITNPVARSRPLKQGICLPGSEDERPCDYPVRYGLLTATAMPYRVASANMPVHSLS